MLSVPTFGSGPVPWRFSKVRLLHESPSWDEKILTASPASDAQACTLTMACTSDAPVSTRGLGETDHAQAARNHGGRHREALPDGGVRPGGVGGVARVVPAEAPRPYLRRGEGRRRAVAVSLARFFSFTAFFTVVVIAVQGAGVAVGPHT